MATDYTTFLIPPLPRLLQTQSRSPLSRLAPCKKMNKVGDLIASMRKQGEECKTIRIDRQGVGGDGISRRR
jgi:hypothetical protein